ncbi:MAG: phosphoribosylformylglycinamidine synthase subunit PurQ, partial [Azonexus sp.]|nr:phosphoribosylformylglycinamidine synthase subunit PurQ [Azonexus sp.]
KTKTPQLAVDQGETDILLLDLGKNRLGGSALAQVYNATGNDAPDVDDPAKLKGLFDAVQKLNRDGLLLAYHDRSDGGLFVAACEMAFASRRGVSLDLDGICFDAQACDIDGSEKRPDLMAGRDFENMVKVLFNEELGALIQIRRDDRAQVTPILRACGVPYHFVGTLNDWDEIRVTRNAKRVLREKRVDLQRAWSETSYQMQAMRDNPDCARQEFDRILDLTDPGLTPKVTFDAQEDFTKVYLQVSDRPRVAILREQGVNSHYEMAAAFDKAGFAAVDVHMSDILSGRVSLKDFKGLVACGGFSYGDVLGAGQGWAKTILMHDGCRDEFAAFFKRQDTFALGVCNGCQMMSALKAIIPGAEHWPAFRRNQVEQFEAR